jgi:hypothetical protein
MSPHALAPPTPSPPFRTRLDALFAANGRTAVLLRRGPRAHVNLIVWDLRDDRFEAGQWMRGQVRLCDLSPDGDKLLYWAMQCHPSAARRRAAQASADPFDPARARAPTLRPGRKVPRYLQTGAGNAPPRPRANTGTWTAISTPPYFTALAIWPALGSWTGGGGVLADRVIYLNEPENGLTPVVNVALPVGLRIVSMFDPADGTPRHSATFPCSRAAGDHAPIWQALQAGGLVPIDWTHVAAGDLLFAGGGKVFRLDDWAGVAPADYMARARLLIDVADQRFRLLAAPPSALRW